MARIHSPASIAASDVVNRSVMNSLARRSSSLVTGSARSAASDVRKCAARASYPAGDRSVSRWSNPATPRLVARFGSSADCSSTKRSANSKIGESVSEGMSSSVVATRSVLFGEVNMEGVRPWSHAVVSVHSSVG